MRGSIPSCHFLRNSASSTGRCNTFYSVDPTILLIEKRSLGLYSIKPEQGSVFFESTSGNEIGL